MIALLLMTALSGAGAPAVESLAVESPHRFDLGASFVYGLGGLPAYGGYVEGTYGRQVWRTGSATGLLEAGLMLGYQAEPFSAFAPMFGEAQLTGANHRLEAWLVVGHGLRLPPSRRVILGVQLFGGWTHVLVRGALENEAQGVSGRSSADAGTFATGVMGQLGVRVTDEVAITARAIAPLPYALAINPWFMASVGVSVRVR